MFIRPMQTGIIQASGGLTPYQAWADHADTVLWFDARTGLVDNSARADSFNMFNGGTLTSTSFQMTAASHHLTTNTASNQFTDFTGDFTIEGDINLNATGSKAVWSTNGDRIVSYDSNAYYEIVGHNSHTSIGTGRRHFCHMRVGTTCYVFNNGSLVTSFGLNGNLGASSYIFFIGSQWGVNGATGDIYAVRYTRKALYNTVGFTPPGNYLGI